MDADQQADGLDGQPLQPHRLDQRLHRLEHLGGGQRSEVPGADERHQNARPRQAGTQAGTWSGSVGVDPRFCRVWGSAVAP